MSGSGLEMECYGSPEVIERVLFSKLSGKDHLNLRASGDVLMELEIAKTEGYLSRLS